MLSVLPESHLVLATLLRRTAARVSEGLQLNWQYVGKAEIIFAAPTTKGRRETRTVSIHPDLADQLSSWRHVVAPLNGSDHWVFPGRNPGEHLTRRGFDHVLRKAAGEIGMLGISTHTFRRSFLTAASQNGIPLRNIQPISGHSSLTRLSNYLDLSESAKNDCVMVGA